VRKPRSDSKLLNLPEEQRDQILDWIRGRPTVHGRARDGAKRIWRAMCGLGVYGFYQQEAPKAFIKRRLQSLGIAQQIAEDAKKRPAQFSAATTEQIAQIAFELSINPKATPADIKTFYDLLLKSRDQDLEARRVSLMEQKAAQAEKAQGVMSDSKLTESEKQTRLRQIFGAA
jgi:hypothetical protein